MPLICVLIVRLLNIVKEQKTQIRGIANELNTIYCIYIEIKCNTWYNYYIILGDKFVLERGMYVLNPKQSKAKEYLKQAYRCNEILKENIQEIENLRILSTSISSPNLSKERVASSHSTEAKYVGAVIKTADLEKEVNQEIVELLDLKMEIRNTINQILDANRILVLRYRYLEFMKWEEIAEKMGYYSVKSAHRIHKAALEDVAKILESKEAA